MSITPVRPTQWSQYGVAVFDQHTTEEAIQAAGLDWTVSLTPDFQVLKDGSYRAVPKRYHVVRDDTEGVLGHVSEKYEPYQNLDGFSFFNPILASGLASLDSADELQGGRTVWLTAKFNEPILVAGLEEEQVDMYVLLRTSHDGSKAISVDITPVRLRCSNTLNLALQSTIRTWKVNHTRALHDRMAEVREVVENLGVYTQTFQKVADQLISTQMELDNFGAFVGQLLPNQSDKLHEKVVEHHLSTPTLTDEIRATRWGALNSVGEYFQHCRNYRLTDRAMDQDWFGSSMKIRNRALALLTN